MIGIFGETDPPKTTTCVSCGRTIPEGQGRSCSTCYGDIDYGRDGYAREEYERDEQEAAYRAAEEAARERDE